MQNQSSWGRMMKRCMNNIDNSFKLVAVQGGGGGGGAEAEGDEQSLLSPASSSPPWLTIPIQEPESKFFNPTNNKVYLMKKRCLPDPKEAVCVGSSHGWLAFIDSKCVIYLINPFKNPDIDSCSSIQLPSIETLPCILGVEREREYGIVDFKYWNYYKSRTYTAPSNDTFKFFISKLVLSSAPDDDVGEGYTAMAIYGELNDLAFCKSGDTSWTPLNDAKLLDDGKLASYEDIYYSATDQCFYAYRNNGSFEIWDLRCNSPPKCTYIHLPPLTSSTVPPSLTSHQKWLRSWCSPKMYLVNFLGDLLLAIKHLAEQVTEDGQIHTQDDDDDDDTRSYPYKTLAFDVYKLDWVQKQWVHVTCLGDGDGVLFLGVNNAMTFSASDFPALRGNSIYFTDDNYDTMLHEELSHGGHDLGIFSLEDGSMHPCFYPGDFKKISPPPVWIAPPNGLA